MARSPKRVVADAAPLSDSDVGRLLISYGVASHGYDNRIVVSALLQFASTWLITQITPRHRGRMVDKFCDDLLELIADKEAKLRAHDSPGLARQSRAHPKGKKAKAEKARPLRR